MHRISRIKKFSPNFPNSLFLARILNSNAIEKLETRNLKINEQMDVIEMVKSKLKGFALNKLEESSKKSWFDWIDKR